MEGASGDRLNFGLAAEQAKAEGFKVEVVIVGDDCALPEQGASKRRGISGLVLVYKASGFCASFIDRLTSSFYAGVHPLSRSKSCPCLHDERGQDVQTK